MSSLLNNSDYIHKLLLEKRVINKKQSELALQMAVESSGELNVISALKKLKLVDDEKIRTALASEYGMETVDLPSIAIPPEAIEAVPQEVAREYRIMPIGFFGDILKVAISDPTDIGVIDSIRFVLKRDIEGVIASAEQINKLIEHHYGTLNENVDSFLQNMNSTEGVESTVSEGGKEEEEEGDEAPIIKLVSLIITEAYRKRASDIHFEPLEKKFRVRYRIDGVLYEVDNPPKYLQANLLSRIKIMAKLDIAEKRVPQDGRIQLKIKDRILDLRVSTVPTSHGEGVVMRILDKSSIMLDISSLGFFPDDVNTIEKIISMPDGVFLVTGPTGSGKTTSLYAFLNTVNKPTKKIITVEDPIEYHLEGINQVQVNAFGMTFAAALRSMMRQSPNIIMVGEIRDGETAEIAINAALTGHLVFSTLHTNDAPSAITRLLDIGIKPFLVASAVRAVMAQRLVRRVCPNCAVPYEPTQDELDIMKLDKNSLKDANFKKGKGCEDCHNSGFKGRVVIVEIFMLTEDLQNMIFKGSSSYQIKEAARRGGMKTLREDGIRKVMAGITTLEEVVGASVEDSQ